MDTLMERQRNLSEIELDQVTGGASNTTDAWGAFALQMLGVRTGAVNYQYERGVLGPGLQR